MKPVFLTVIALTLLLALAGISQTPANHIHKVVFEVNSPSPAWDQVLNNIANMQTAFAPETVQVEVVCFGPGLDLLLKTNIAFEARLKKLVAGNEKTAACMWSLAGIPCGGAT